MSAAVDQSWRPQPDTTLTPHTPNNDRAHCLAFNIIDATTTTLDLWQVPHSYCGRILQRRIDVVEVLKNYKYATCQCFVSARHPGSCYPQRKRPPLSLPSLLPKKYVYSPPLPRRRRRRRRSGSPDLLSAHLTPCTSTSQPRKYQSGRFIIHHA
jgi:hypothetical protein